MFRHPQIRDEEIASINSLLLCPALAPIRERIGGCINGMYKAFDGLDQPIEHPLISPAWSNELRGTKIYVTDKRLGDICRERMAGLLEYPMGLDGSRVSPFHRKDHYIFTLRVSSHNAYGDILTHAKNIKEERKRSGGCTPQAAYRLYGDSADIMLPLHAAESSYISPTDVPKLIRKMVGFAGLSNSLLMFSVNRRMGIVHLILCRCHLPPERAWNLQVEEMLQDLKKRTDELEKLSIKESP